MNPKVKIKVLRHLISSLHGSPEGSPEEEANESQSEESKEQKGLELGEIHDEVKPTMASDDLKPKKPSLGGNYHPGDEGDGNADSAVKKELNNNSLKGKEKSHSQSIHSNKYQGPKDGKKPLPNASQNKKKVSY